MTVVERTVVIGSAVGLHARPAARFTTAVAASAPTRVTLTDASGRTVDAASILGVLSLGIPYGATVTLRAEGPDAAAVLDALASLLAAELDTPPDAP